MFKAISFISLVLLVISVTAAAEITNEEIQALQTKEASGVPLAPAEKSLLESYLTQQQLMNPWLDNSWGTDGWYSAVDQASGGQPYNWMDISATGTEVWPGQDQDDTFSPMIRLPFTFPFYWMTKDSISVSANVILKFDGSLTPSYSTAVPSATQPSRIDPWCFDMYHHGTDTVGASHYYYQSFGDSLFVVQFKQARYFTTPQRYDETYGKDLEVLLYSNGKIVFQYDTLRSFIAGSPYNSGIDDSMGVAGLSCGSTFSNGQAITFTRLTGVILANGQVSPISGTTATNFLYTIQYRNTANLPPASAQIYIDDVAYALTDPTGGLGNYMMGVTFNKSTTLPVGAHNYYFEFTYGSNTYRFPETGYLSGPTVYAPFSGSYDIGGGAMNFTTIVAAVTALSGAGLAGPVTFNVYDGTYDGQVILPYTIPGLSATNTLTIQAAPGQSPVVVNSTGTTNTTGTCFHITGADYITIKGFEIRNCYGAGVYVYYGATSADSARFVTIENNSIHDVGTGGSYHGIYSYYTKNISILNNKIQGDYYGLYMYYNTYATVANNMIWGQDYYGVYNYYGSFATYYYNTIYMNSAYAATNYAMYQTTSSNNVYKNNIIINAGSGSTTKYAFYLSGTIATYPITSDYNDLQAPNGGSVGYYTAARATLAAWQTATALDANSISANPNFISTVLPFNFHINSAGGSLVNGRATPVSVTNDIDYEARNAVTPDIGADEFTLPAGVLLSSGQVTPPSGLVTTNFVYQILYTNSGNLAPISAQVYIDNVPYALTDSTGGSGNYANGVNFYRTTTLPGGTHNYYFEFVANLSRDTYRFPAAGYLTGPTVLSPFNGNYDIGGGANHYPTMVAAATDLAVAGVSGPTIFNVYNGTYDGQVNLPYTIPGLSATNTLKFQAASGASPIVVNSTGVALTTGCGFYITGADYITIKGFEIKNCYGAGVYVYYGSALADSARYITIENNNIHDVGTGGTYYGIYSYYTKNISILNNKIQGDYYGLYMYYNTYATVANNLIWGQDYYGVYNYYGSYASYYYNTIYMNSVYATTNYAMYEGYGSNITLKDNIIINAGSGATTKYAIYMPGLITTYPTVSNYNDLYAPNGGSVGYYNAVAQATLTAWRTATGLDANSISANPNFISTVLPFNFHINNTAPSPVNATATPVPVTVDFDYEARDAVTPDIGADEFTVPTYNVAVGPTPQSQTGNAGTDVAYYYSVTNTSNVPESFNLSTLGATWSTAMYDSAGTTLITATPTLAVAGVYWVKVVHSIPGSAIGGSSDAGSLKAVSVTNPTVFASGAFTTTATMVLSVTVTPETQSLLGNPGSGVDYYYYVHNGSNLPDAFNLATFGATWLTAIYDSAGTTIITATSTIALGDSQCVKVVHNIPGTALSGAFDTGYLKAVSTHGATAADTSSYTTTASTVIDVTLGPETQNGVANAGSSAEYYYFVRNGSNLPDVFNLSTFGAVWSTAIYDSAGTTIITATPTLGVGDTAWVKVLHSVPGSALVGDYDTGYLTAISTLTRTPADTSSFTTTVPPSYGVAVTPETQQKYVVPGSQAAYYCYVHNTGGIPDSYNLSTFGATWTTAIYDSAGTTIITSTSTLAIDAGEWVKVVHSIPGSAILGDTDTGYLAAVSTQNATTADTAAFTSTVPPILGVTVAPESQNLMGEIGAEVGYYYYIQNGSSMPDAFSLSTFGSAWATAIYDSSGTTIITSTSTIPAGESQWVKVVHSIPGSAQGGDTDTGYLGAISQFYSITADTASFTTSVHQIGSVVVTPETQQDSVNVGTAAEYYYYVLNVGNGPDEFNLSTSGTAWSTAIYDSAGGTLINTTSNLHIGDGQWVKVVHNVPGTAPAWETSTGHLIAASTHYRVPADTSSFATTALNYGVAITPPSWNSFTFPGMNVAYYFCIHNTGAFPEAYNLATSGAAWSTAIYDSAGTTIISSTSTLALGGGEWVKVVHSVPSTALPGESDTGQLTALAIADSSVTATASFTATALLLPPPPEPPTLVAPPDEAINVPCNPTMFDWVFGTGVINCHLQVALDSTFTSIVWDSTTTQDSLALGLDFSTEYFWRMRSWNTLGGFSSWTEVWEFRTFPPLSITLTPYNPPIIVPAGGGAFDFDITLNNNTTSSQDFDVWTMVQTPQMTFVAALGPVALTLPAESSMLRARSQAVPALAPAGDYLYRGYVGDHPWVVAHMDSFSFSKAGTNFDNPCPTSGWWCSGELFPGEVLNTAALVPTVFSVTGAAPNPFNPTTTISIALPEACHVTLTVYNISGRQVAQIGNSLRPAGIHELTFDGSNLASGIYLYALTAGNHKATGKMVLLK